MNYHVRRALEEEFWIDLETIQQLHASSDTDSIILSRIIKEPGYHIDIAKLLYADNHPIATLYSLLIDNTSNIPIPCEIDHPIADYLRSTTFEDFLHVAKKWNDARCWDIVIMQDVSVNFPNIRDAAFAGSPIGMMHHAYYNEMSQCERKMYFEQAGVSWILNRETTNAEDCYMMGRLLDAIKSPIRPLILKFYRDMRQMATKAVVTWLLCAKKLGIYRDLARLIGEIVLRESTLYEQIPTRCLKRPKN
jgi:hypothetical protein